MCWTSWPRCATGPAASRRIAARLSPRVREPGVSEAAQARASTTISARARCSRPGPGAASSATRWAWARRSRRWRPPRSWRRHFGVERVLIVCPTSLKHQWEREIGRFTDRQATVVGGLRARREQHFAAADGFFKITNYDTVHADLDLIAAWSPGPRHSRRGAAHQELEHAHGAKREAHRLAVRHRADRHAAREPPGGADLDRRVRRPAPARPDVPLPGRPPGARRARQGGRLPRPRSHRQDAGADPDPPEQEAGARATARAARQELLRADDARADRAPRGEPGDRRADRRQVARATSSCPRPTSAG